MIYRMRYRIGTDTQNSFRFCFQAFFCVIWIIAHLSFFARPTHGATHYQITSESPQHHFVLVIDRSGSMTGQALQQAKNGALSFIDGLGIADQIAVLAFDNRVELLQEMTGNRAAARKAVSSLSAGGATALYDGVARAAGLLSQLDGQRIVVFLTDGADTDSRYGLNEIRQMGSYEAIFMFGLGLGQVDAESLSGLAEATGGKFLTTANPQELNHLYDEVLSSYYERAESKLASTGGLTVNSIPGQREVTIDGQVIGLTPVKLDYLPPDSVEVSVAFDRGDWVQAVPIQIEKRTVVDAREDQLGYDVWIASKPNNAAVFLDGSYVGLTGMGVVKTTSKKWPQAVKKNKRSLRLPMVPQGRHRLRLLAMPDFDFGPEQELEIEISVDDRERVFLVNLLGRKVFQDDGPILVGKKKSKTDDPFGELDAELENY